MQGASFPVYSEAFKENKIVYKKGQIGRMESWLRDLPKPKAVPMGESGKLAKPCDLYFYWMKPLNFRYICFPWLLVQRYPRESKA